MKVVSLSPLWGDELAQRLPAGIALVNVDPLDGAALDDQLPSATILITTTFDAAMAQRCRSLELIICPAAGTEGIDRDALAPGVRLRNGVGHEIPIAEYIIGALVALRHRFAAADAALRHGSWALGFFGDRTMAGELFGSRLGMIGFGRIAHETVARARAFGMRVRAVTAHPERHAPAGDLDAPVAALSDPAAVDALVSWSDAVAVVCELSPLTTGLIDARRLALMRADAVLVNVARGPIVDETALYDALKRRAIGGAALDVWYRYPETRGASAAPSRLPFAQLDNVLMTPHSSGWTQGAKQRKLDFLVSAITERAASSR